MPTSAMDGNMTTSTERNQVLFAIVPLVATKLFVVDFQVRH
jgi:hypothetical protein